MGIGMLCIAWCFRAHSPLNTGLRFGGTESTPAGAAGACLPPLARAAEYFSKMTNTIQFLLIDDYCSRRADFALR